jgi:hypothetical protein
MFAVYHPNDKHCDFVREVSIAGVLCAHIDSEAETIKPTKPDTMPWKLSGHALCRAVKDIEAGGPVKSSEVTNHAEKGATLEFPWQAGIRSARQEGHSY